MEPDGAERDRARGRVVERSQNAVESSKESRRARRDRRRAGGDDPGRVRWGEILDPEPTSPERRRGSPRGHQARRGDARGDLVGARGEVEVRETPARGRRRAIGAPEGDGPGGPRRRCDYAHRGVAPAERRRLRGDVRVHRGGRRVPGRRAEGDREWGTVQRQRGGGARQGGENQRVVRPTVGRGGFSPGVGRKGNRTSRRRLEPSRRGRREGREGTEAGGYERRRQVPLRGDSIVPAQVRRLGREGPGSSPGEVDEEAGRRGVVRCRRAHLRRRPRGLHRARRGTDRG